MNVTVVLTKEECLTTIAACNVAIAHYQQAERISGDATDFRTAIRRWETLLPRLHKLMQTAP